MYLPHLVHSTVVIGRSTIIRHLAEDDSRSAGVAFFFCDGVDPHKQVTPNILGSLCMQLLDLVPADLVPKILTCTEHCNLGINDRERDRVKILQDLLVALAEELSEVILVIDGLDECKCQQNLLAALPDGLHPNLKCILSSCGGEEMEKVIRTRWGRHTTLAIGDQYVLADIKTYLAWQFAHDAKLSRFKPAMQEEVSKKLLDDKLNGSMYHLTR